MQNGMTPAQLTPHNRPYFVLTSKILIPPSKSGKTRRRLARRLVGRQACRLGGQVAAGVPFCARLTICVGTEGRLADDECLSHATAIVRTNTASHGLCTAD